LTPWLTVASQLRVEDALPALGAQCQSSATRA